MVWGFFKYPKMELPNPFSSLVITSVLQPILSGVSIATPAFLFISIFMKYLFLSLHFQSVYVVQSETSLLQTADLRAWVCYCWLPWPVLPCTWAHRAQSLVNWQWRQWATLPCFRGSASKTVLQWSMNIYCSFLETLNQVKEVGFFPSLLAFKKIT